ncbi:hypothetical protein Agub_g9886 [Astrephomene gubernaculifera]|uniref:Uncharacterized protein n=1 Tax=Astrephomene gubernaculifera TaxID=47775 RepID=A0AAD3HPI2_9CHLO|nr:hypothetical protein Agub_g9886 [Astrephomene gubernaculifera]
MRPLACPFRAVSKPTYQRGCCCSYPPFHLPPAQTHSIKTGAIPSSREANGSLLSGPDHVSGASPSDVSHTPSKAIESTATSHAAGDVSEYSSRLDDAGGDGGDAGGSGGDGRGDMRGPGGSGGPGDSPPLPQYPLWLRVWLIACGAVYLLLLRPRLFSEREERRRQAEREVAQYDKYEEDWSRLLAKFAESQDAAAEKEEQQAGSGRGKAKRRTQRSAAVPPDDLSTSLLRQVGKEPKERGGSQDLHAASLGTATATGGVYKSASRN